VPSLDRVRKEFAVASTTSLSLQARLRSASMRKTRWKWFDER
jgi:hypothetical protein